MMKSVDVNFLLALFGSDFGLLLDSLVERIRRVDILPINQPDLQLGQIPQ